MALTKRKQILISVLAGVIVGVGLLFLYLLRAHTYVGDDPAACVNCHVMAPYYATWKHSSHGRDATCNDCHVPHGENGLSSTPAAIVPYPESPGPEWLRKMTE